MNTNFEGVLTQLEEQGVARDEMLAILASSTQTAGSYLAFYELVFGQPPPPHAYDWVDKVFKAREDPGREGVVIEAFRGSTKTTTLTIGLTAFIMAHNPTWAILLIQVGDDIATDNTQQIADLIAHNPGFRLAFPHIAPDRERGWGAAGYEIMDTSTSYDQWRAKNSKRKDPSLMGVGYKSRAIIGKHPDWLLVDDIHDENNTSSVREMAAVTRRVASTIVPTMMKHTFAVYVGTPWHEEDTLHMIKDTGDYAEIHTPALVFDEKGDHEWDGEPCFLTWPDYFDVGTLQARRNLVGEVEFARMYLLSLDRAKIDGLKYFSYPNENISADWLHVHGVDYASIITQAQANARGRSYFALAYVAKLPTGGAVVVDGVRTRCTQQEAEDYILRAQNMYKNVRTTVVEADGKGEEFVAILRRNPDVKFQPEKTRGRGKAERLQRQMSPWFENGHIRISDASTPFLDTLRREMQDFPNGTEDCLDAVYWALRGMPEVLALNREMETPAHRRRRQRRINPWASLGRL